MVTNYYNKAGKKVVIANMPDAYLVNAVLHYKKNIAEIEAKLETNPTLEAMVSLRLEELRDIRDSLVEEVKKRNLSL